MKGSTKGKQRCTNGFSKQLHCFHAADHYKKLSCPTPSFKMNTCHAASPRICESQPHPNTPSIIGETTTQKKAKKPQHNKQSLPTNQKRRIDVRLSGFPPSKLARVELSHSCKSFYFSLISIAKLKALM